MEVERLTYDGDLPCVKVDSQKNTDVLYAIDSERIAASGPRYLEWTFAVQKNPVAVFAQGFLADPPQVRSGIFRILGVR